MALIEEINFHESEHYCDLGELAVFGLGFSALKTEVQIEIAIEARVEQSATDTDG
jgi:hypothetical protein